MPSSPSATTVASRFAIHSAARARVVMAAALSLLGITPEGAVAQDRYVAPDNNTVRTFLESARGQVNTKIVRVENLSTVPIVVTQVVLLNCNNVGYVCGTNEMETTVEPGKRKTVLEVEPGVISRAASFNYRFRWRHKTKEAILGTLATGGDSAAALRLEQIRIAEAARAASSRPGEAELLSQDLVARSAEVVMLRADPDTVVIPVGGAITTNMLRIIAVDSSGQSLGRVRTSYGFTLEGGPAVSLARPDSVIGRAPGRQVLTLRFPPALSEGRATPLNEVLFTIIVR